MHYIDYKLQFIVIIIGEQDQQVNMTPDSILFHMSSFWDRMSNGKTFTSTPLFPKGLLNYNFQ